ncbi:MAG: hypothetical protein LAO77_01650 [Acidobacteriia bacterium]|nr:hypothetical protein [Terriglobia bacterium]
MVLLFTAILGAAPVGAQTPAASSARESSSSSQDAPQNPEPGILNPEPGTLPVSLDKIRGALQQKQAITLRTLDERPTFRVQILERQRIEELLATLNFKSSSPAPAGGLYGYEQQRQIWNPVDNPMMQPFAAFNQGELLTIALENLIGKYVVGQGVTAVKNAIRTSQANAAREEVRQAITDYCAAQPNNGAGIAICETSNAFPR